MTNIVRHSKANKVSIILSIAPGGELCLEVSDNGKGFNPSAISDISFGVIGMKERAAIMDGDLQIVSSPGNGCYIRLIVPENKLYS